MYSDHCAINVETKNKRISGNYKNPWIVNDLLLNNRWVKEAKKEIKKTIGNNENKNTHTKMSRKY